MTTNALPPKAAVLPLRVLIADDDRSITKMFGWMLEMLGHEARAAHDGLEALELARSFQPDVALLDLNLPEIKGHELCKRMRTLPGMEKCTFIAQTGWDQPEQIERSRQAGFHDHWVKPIPLERLEKLLASLSRKAAA